MAKRWNPGHYYLVTDDMTRSSLILPSRRDLVKNNPYIRGYMGQFWWHRHETSKGVYDFSKILQFLDTCAADGKMGEILPCNRTFHGTNRGGFVPSYIINEYNGIYYYSGAGENFGGPKIWEPAIRDRWNAYLAALIDAVDSHPAFQLIYAEEGSMSGCWLQSGYSWQAHNESILSECRVGRDHCINGLFHENTAWSNEDGGDIGTHHVFTDTIVKDYKLGCAPNDVVTNNHTALESPYGEYVYDRYRGKAYFAGGCEWSGHFYGWSPLEVIDFAVDRLGLHFMHWIETIGASGQTFDTYDAMDALIACQGKINTAKPTNVSDFDAAVPPTISDKITDNDYRWDWNINPERSFAEQTIYNVNRQVTDLAPAQFSDSGVLPTNDGSNQLLERVSDPAGTAEFVYKHQIRSDRNPGLSFWGETWRSELVNTQETPIWNQEYWAAFALYLEEDGPIDGPAVSIFDFHIPWPYDNPVVMSPFALIMSENRLLFSTRYNANTPSDQNDYAEPLSGSWSEFSPRKKVWHNFVLNFKLGADSDNNFMRIWRAIGSSPLEQIMNYTGRIGYDASNSRRFNYAKFGLYSWTYPWPSNVSSSCTIYTKGFRLIKGASGNPTISKEAMLALLNPSNVVVLPPPVEKPYILVRQDNKTIGTWPKTLTKVNIKNLTGDNLKFKYQMYNNIATVSITK